MKKIIALTLLLCTLTLLLSSCGSNKDVKIEKPEDTNLEYWLLDRPDKNNWIKLDSPSDAYLAQGYEAIIDENGEKSLPEQAVFFYLSHYPTAEIGIKIIDSIHITDPNVYVWGLTFNSTKEEIKEVMKVMGFNVEIGKYHCTAEKDNYRFIIRYGKKIEIYYRQFSIINSIYFGQKAYQ